MDVYEAIAKRFSVRTFQDKPVEPDKLERILTAGRDAPSGRNRQMWKFVVVRDARMRQELSKAAEQPFLAKAPVIIAVVGTTPDAIMHCGIPADPVDCAIAIDHMVLAATAEGLGACWIGHFKQDACRELLGIPQSVKIVEMFVLGYPAEGPRPKSRKPLDQVVCHEKYS
ncbi:MAG: nitroreductase family protein [Planctomycetes bacterium]|nr:nitroreductase family protein [Planctomycetota bacterium]